MVFLLRSYLVLPNSVMSLIGHAVEELGKRRTGVMMMMIRERRRGSERRKREIVQEESEKG